MKIPASLFLATLIALPSITSAQVKQPDDPFKKSDSPPEKADAPAKGESTLADEYLQGVMKQVGVFVEYFEVDHKDVPDLLRIHQNETHADETREQVAEMEAKGKARLVESSYIVTRSGQRAKVESIREYQYPTEFDPPELPQKLQGPIDPGANIITPSAPTAFEMRPVGHTLEIDPVIGNDGESIQLNLAPEIVQFMGDNTIGKEESLLRQPMFHSQKVSTALATKDGTYKLFGVFTPAESHARNGKGKRVLGFLRADILLAISRSDLDSLRKDPKKFIDALPKRDDAGDNPFAGNSDENPFDDKPNRKPKPIVHTQVSTIVEFIDVDSKMAAEIVHALGNSMDATAQRRRIDKLIASGDAHVIETSFNITRSGQRAKTESMREWIYPTAGDPPEVPQELRGEIAAELDLMTATSPTAFEMRPLGVTLEIDPVISKDGKVIEINIAPELVNIVGETSYGKGPSEKKQPMFETVKHSTAVTVPEGQTCLLTMSSLESARAHKAGTEEEQEQVRDRRILVLMTAKVKSFE